MAENLEELRDKMEFPSSIIDLAPGDPRWDGALPVLQELRPQLTTDSLAEVYRTGHDEGLRYAAAFDDQGECLAVVGWRVMTKTVGRMFYIDDLVVATGMRGSGVGTAMMEEMTRRAQEAQCRAMALDTGVQRVDAQRFYEGLGMNKDVVYSYLKFLG
jgi:ribosomal protein S18 acetylase RimI-like enzyme